MKRLVLVLALVAGCGYLPGSADDPSASPTAVADCYARPDGPPSCDPDPTCPQYACDAPIVADPTPPPVDPGPAPASPTTRPAPAPPASKPVVNLNGSCGFVYFSAYQMNVFVHATSGSAIVAGASASVTVTGTDARYPAVNQSFSGVTSAPSPGWLPGDKRAASFTASFPLVLPAPTFDAQGRQTETPYATYRCHGSVTFNGQTRAF